MARGLSSALAAAVVAFACACANPSGTPGAPTSNASSIGLAVPRAGQTFTVAGSVRGFTTNAGVAGATVLYMRESSNLTIPGCCVSAVSDASGSYRVSLVVGGDYVAWVDGVDLGSLAVINDVRYRGDLFVQSGTCISRYGVVVDAVKQQPVAGASLTLAGQTIVTDGNGWYRFDFGCPTTVLPGGTTFMYVSHPDYPAATVTVGRGVVGTERLDVLLRQRTPHSP